MPPIDHTFEIADWCFPQCAEIDMNQHKYGQDKTRSYVNKISNMNSAFS